MISFSFIYYYYIFFVPILNFSEGNTPPPRSLHSAVLISDNRMIVLGGMVPKNEEINKLKQGDDPAGKSVWQSEDKVK